VRTERVPHHKGQVCFPGGSRDPGDGDLLATALREAEEEVGIRPGDVEVVGELEAVPTVTGFLIHPFVARLRPSAVVRPDGREIASAFEAPLSHFGDRSRYRRAAATVRGREEEVLFIDFGGRTIWGATARIALLLAERFGSPAPPGL
jgi:8-oxo-dGTP pyrophosphatase MutT (NUDIX family)